MGRKADGWAGNWDLSSFILPTAALASASCPAPPAHMPSPPLALGPGVESEGGQHLEGRWAGAERQLEGRCGGRRRSKGACGLRVGPGCTAALQLAGAQEGRSQAQGRDQGRVGPRAGRLQDGWEPGEGLSPAASAALGASASLFLGINIYRSICCRPYTLGCLPPGKNRAGSPAPPLRFPTRAEDRRGQVRPAASGSAGGNLVACSLAASPAVRRDSGNRGPIAAL